MARRKTEVPLGMSCPSFPLRPLSVFPAVFHREGGGSRFRPPTPLDKRQTRTSNARTPRDATGRPRSALVLPLKIRRPSPTTRRGALGLPGAAGPSLGSAGARDGAAFPQTLSVAEPGDLG